MVDWKEILNDVGTFVASLTQKGLELFQGTGIITSSITAKLISALIVLGLAYFVLSFFKNIQPLVRWLIIIVSILLLISIGITFLPS